MGALRPAVVAVRPAEGAIVTLPGRFRVCQPGDRLYAVGRHDELRKLEAVAASDGEAEHTDSATGSETDTGGGAASG
jgi:K+/H+ antiporter YhaU regulatory subunit KhtT